jgi:hypothetical protein
MVAVAWTFSLATVRNTDAVFAGRGVTFECLLHFDIAGVPHIAARREMVVAVVGAFVNVKGGAGRLLRSAFLLARITGS